VADAIYEMTKPMQAGEMYFDCECVSGLLFSFDGQSYAIPMNIFTLNPVYCYPGWIEVA